MNGDWYRVKQGVRGLLVRTQTGELVVYVMREPPTHRYRRMTRGEWMPCLVDEVI
jgi:hypothetical protein